MTSIKIPVFDKQLLRAIIGISKSTLNRRMKYLNPTILLIDPRYNENSQILRKDIFILICDDFGFSRMDVAERIKNHFPHYQEIDIDELKRKMGLND